MPRSRQTNVLALPMREDHTDQTKAIRIAERTPMQSELLHATVSPQLRFLSFPYPESGPHLTVIVPRDHVRWGAVLAGLLAAVVTQAGLSLFGLAIGVIALPPNGDTIADNAIYYASIAMIWEAGSAVLSLFLGGFVAARAAAASGRGAGFLNGVVVFLCSVVLSISFAGIGMGLLFNALGTNPVDLYVFGLSAINDPGVADVAINHLKQCIAGGLVSLIVGVVMSGFGGLAGYQKESDT